VATASCHWVCNRTTTTPRHRSIAFKTTSTPCLAFFENGSHQLVGRQLTPALVRYLVVIAALSDSLTTRSQETTDRRCHKDVTGHCKGICRCLSTPQVVFRRYQRVDQTSRGTLVSNGLSTPLTITNKQYKDVEDKINDLTPWLERLLQTLAKANPNNDPEETERRSQLARFALHVVYLSHRKLTPYRSLEYIGKRSLALSEKGKVAKVLDKTRDSQEVVGLVEKLRQAILIYQVSVRHRQDLKSLTRRAGVTATVDI